MSALCDPWWSSVKVLRHWTRADAVARASRAWTLRAEGMTWEQVAQECGYNSASTACSSVRRWRESLPEVDLTRARDEAIERGERLWAEAWKDVVDRKPGAVTSAVRVLHRQSELLGTDRPTELVLHTPTAHELQSWVEAVIAQQDAEIIEADIIGDGPLGELEAAGGG